MNEHFINGPGDHRTKAEFNEALETGLAVEKKVARYLAAQPGRMVFTAFEGQAYPCDLVMVDRLSSMVVYVDVKYRNYDTAFFHRQPPMFRVSHIEKLNHLATWTDGWAQLVMVLKDGTAWEWPVPHDMYRLDRLAHGADPKQNVPHYVIPMGQWTPVSGWRG